MLQFPASPITALIDKSPDVNLSESIGPDLSVTDIGDPAGPGRPEPRLRDVGR